MNEEQRRRLVLAKVRDLRRREAKLQELEFGAFFRKAWQILEPKTRFIDNWHIDLISEYLTACRNRQIKNLILNMPPREAKSLMVSVSFPCWIWTTEPWERFMCFSYAQTLSTKLSVDRRALIESPWYQANWGHRVKLAEDQNQKTEFLNTNRGHMIAASMTGAAVGKGGNFLIIDDPHDTTRAGSRLKREADIVEYDRKVQSRLDDTKNGVKIIVMQRLDEKDLTGHVIAKERDAWTWVRLPIEAPKSVYIKFPLSGRIVKRKKGDLLNPERRGPAEVKGLKVSFGSYGFAGQFQQNPSPAAGGILKRKWWKYYRALPDRFDVGVISIDCSFDDTENSAEVCMQAWGKKGSNSYMVGEVHEQMDFPTTMETFHQFCISPFFPALKHMASNAHLTVVVSDKVIEKKANGAALRKMLMNKISGLNEYSPQTDKVSRARAVSPWVEAGNVYLPDPTIYPDVGSFVDQCAAFPKSDLADRVDTMTQALIRFMMKDSGEFTKDMIPNGETTHAPGRKTEDQW